jgi:DNA processing protein
MLTKDEQIILWLDMFDTLSIKKKYNILKAYNTPSDVFASFKNDYKRFQHLLDDKLFSKMCYALDSDFINKQQLEYEKMNVELVTKCSKTYPKLLLETGTPPLVLYCRGDVSLLNTECLAVVGTRRPTKYGRKVTEKFVKELASNDFTIVSGMADGIDTASHRACLSEGGKTIAVLGGGVNEIYPYSNLGLSREITEKGLIISEYKPDQKAVGFHFPIRNRIIAGISRGVLIPEAAPKSGSMHTKEYAIEAGRDLFVVPGNIDSRMSEGTNQVIKNLQACMVTRVEDILDVYGKINNYEERRKKSFQLNMEEQLIINAIGKEEAHYEELLKSTKLDSKSLNTLLTTMQVRGIIKKLPGNIYTV